MTPWSEAARSRCRASATPLAPKTLLFPSALASVEGASPGGRVTWLYLPTTPDAPLAVRKRMPGEWHPNGRSYVYVDRHSGRILSVHNAMQGELGTKLYDVLYPLHIGRFGLWSKILYALAGLAPVLLAIGGPLIWWDRRVRAKKRLSAVSRAAARPRVEIEA